MSNNILILGNGFIGSNLYSYFSQYDNTIVTNRHTFDITRSETYNNVPWSQFNTIIYTIGIKDVPYCEKQPDIAFDINANYISNIFSLINAQTKFIYISTDYVFDGISGNYKEDSETKPTTIYGCSKLKGELISRQHDNYIVIRTSGVYGNGCMWLSKLLSSLDSSQKIECYTNIYNTPTYAMNLAEMIKNLINEDFTGTIHLAGSSVVNRLDLYTTVATIFGRDTSILYGGQSTNNRFPNNLSLCNKKYATLFNRSPDDIRTGLSRLKSNYAY
jgi:dTDP-4-dehydrorhamnose reductase